MKFKLFIPLVFIGIIGCNSGNEKKVEDNTNSENTEIKNQEDGFLSGYPTDKKAQELFDEFDYQAAVQAYIWATPVFNSMGIWNAFERDMGIPKDQIALAIYDKKQQPHQTIMTANNEVVYIFSNFINTIKHGPVVVEIPPGGLGLSIDLWQRALQDFGNLGPDEGKGGKYLFLPVDYQGEIPDEYFSYQLKYSDHFLFGSRTFPNDPKTGGLEGAVAQAKEIKIYPLSQADNPPPTKIVMVGDSPFDHDWPKDERAFSLLAEAINRDRVPESGLSTLGNLRRLGIEKGKPFEPDSRAKKILKKAAEKGYDIVRAMAFNNRFDNALVYENRQWERIANYKSPVFLPGNYEEIEERAGGWFQLIGNSSKLVPKKAGTGVFYVTTYKDKEGEVLDGSKTYKLTMMADVPVKQFWQVPVYSNKTRSLINTPQKRPTRSSNDGLIKNEDGSIDVYFGPNAPIGFEENWIQTIPGEGWFVLLRLYGPEQEILDKTWEPNDIERIK